MTHSHQIKSNKGKGAAIQFFSWQRHQPHNLSFRHSLLGLLQRFLIVGFRRLDDHSCKSILCLQIAIPHTEVNHAGLVRVSRSRCASATRMLMTVPCPAIPSSLCISNPVANALAAHKPGSMSDLVLVRLSSPSRICVPSFAFCPTLSRFQICLFKPLQPGPMRSAPGMPPKEGALQWLIG